MEMIIRTDELNKILISSGMIPENTDIEGIARAYNGIKIYLIKKPILKDKTND